MSKLKVQTPFGQKLKKQLSVYRADDSSALCAQFDTLETIINQIKKHPVTYKSVRSVLSHFKNIEMTLERIYALETLSVTELFEMKHFVLTFKQLKEVISKTSLNITWMDLSHVEKLLDPDQIGINSFYIYDSYSDELKNIRHAIKMIDGQILEAKKEKRSVVADKYSIKIRPTDEFHVKKHEKELIDRCDQDDEIMYISETMMYRSYKIKTSESILDLGTKLDQLKLQEEEEELNIRKVLTERLNNHLDEIQYNINEIGQLDLFMGKAYFANAYNMTKPIIGRGIVIKNGVHLKVQDYLLKEQLTFMPIDIHVNKGVSCITGANMGGKTICLRLLGQMIAMAQLGLFVPCEYFEFEPMNFIFLSSQDAQSIDKGLSTFGAEMVNISKVLQQADKKGLILIDELARGTNPKEGHAISQAIINYLKRKESISVLTTHYDGLADEEDVLHLQVKGLKHVNFEDLEINIKGDLETIHELMDYRLEIVTAKEAVPKDAINISKLMGVDDEILEDAKRILMNREEQ